MNRFPLKAIHVTFYFKIIKFKEQNMKTFGWIVLSIIILFAVSVLATGGRIIGIAEDHVAHSVENAVVNYNDYQDIYATCNS